jgi:hypothetical protein
VSSGGRQRRAGAGAVAGVESAESRVVSAGSVWTLRSLAAPSAHCPPTPPRSTGRKRRCGWFDAVVVRYAHTLNSFTSLNLTKLDVLDELEEVKIGIAYSLDGEMLPAGSYPSTLEDLSRVSGWQAGRQAGSSGGGGGGGGGSGGPGGAPPTAGPLWGSSQRTTGGSSVGG